MLIRCSTYQDFVIFLMDFMFIFLNLICVPILQCGHGCLCFDGLVVNLLDRNYHKCLI